MSEWFKQYYEDNLDTEINCCIDITTDAGFVAAYSPFKVRDLCIENFKQLISVEALMIHTVTQNA